MKRLNVFGDTDSNKQLFRMGLGILVIFLLFGSAMFTFEGSSLNNIFGYVYFAVVTLTTVGYGDIVPETPLGRFTVFLSLMALLFIFPSEISKLLASWKAKQTQYGHLPGKFDRKKYFLICGNVDEEQLASIVQECTDNQVRKVVFVNVSDQPINGFVIKIASSCDISICLREIDLSRTVYSSDLGFNPREAQGVALLTRLQPISSIPDQRIIASLKNLMKMNVNPSNIATQLYSSEYAEFAQVEGFKDAFSTLEIGGCLLAKSLSNCKGIIPFICNLTLRVDYKNEGSFHHIVKTDTSSKIQTARREYLASTSNVITKEPLVDWLVGESFLRAALGVSKLGITLIGVERRSTWEAKLVLLNPLQMAEDDSAHSLILKTGDELFIISHNGWGGEALRKISSMPKDVQLPERYAPVMLPALETDESATFPQEVSRLPNLAQFYLQSASQERVKRAVDGGLILVCGYRDILLPFLQHLRSFKKKDVIRVLTLKDIELNVEEYSVQVCPGSPYLRADLLRAGLLEATQVLILPEEIDPVLETADLDVAIASTVDLVRSVVNKNMQTQGSACSSNVSVWSEVPDHDLDGGSGVTILTVVNAAENVSLLDTVICRKWLESSGSTRWNEATLPVLGTDRLIESTECAAGRVYHPALLRSFLMQSSVFGATRPGIELFQLLMGMKPQYEGLIRMRIPMQLVNERGRVLSITPAVDRHCKYLLYKDVFQWLLARNNLLTVGVQRGTPLPAFGECVIVAPSMQTYIWACCDSVFVLPNQKNHV